MKPTRHALTIAAGLGALAAATSLSGCANGDATERSAAAGNLSTAGAPPTPSASASTTASIPTATNNHIHVRQCWSSGLRKG